MATHVDGAAGGRLAPPLRGLCIVAPELERIGGYELATLALVRQLRSQAVRVVVVTTATAAVDSHAIDGATRIDVRGRQTLLAVFPRLLGFMLRRRSAVSVVYCPTFSYLSGLAILVARIIKRPAIVRVATENDVREFQEATTRKGRLFYSLLRQASAVVAPSGAIRDELLRAGFPESRIALQPNFVDGERFLPVSAGERLEAKRRLGVPDDALTIGTVARLVARKRLDVLLRAFASTVIQGRDVRLLIVGTGPLAAELQHLARELMVERSVVWAGLQRDPRPWLCAMDVFALPSRLEGSPNSVLEAMASGVAIVGTRIGGVVDLIEDQATGLLVPPDDPQALALALDRLLRDPALRTALGTRARHRAEESFSLRMAAARLTELCRAVQVPRRPG
jgi:glycosyltransferase involved in cell wall biosynthesis